METSSMLDSDTADRVNDLIRINIDSAKGFRAAAEVVNDVGLRTRFEQYAAQRDSNAHELRQFVAGSGEEPEDSGSAGGAVHRWWMDLRSKATGGDAGVVLSEAERGEDAIKHTYEKAMVDIAGSPVSEVLQRQYTEVKRGHDTIRDLRDAVKGNGG